MAISKPTVQYFAIRGRAEPIRITLSAAGVEFAVAEVDYAQMKSDLEKFPFAQVPRYFDEEVDITQSNAIMRHLGRKHSLYGSSPAEAAQIDQVVDGVEDIKRKYLMLIYQDQLADEAKAEFWKTHCDPASAHARNGGAHFLYLSNLLKRNGGGSGWVVGGAPSIADFLLFDIVDLHLRIFDDKLRQAYPELVALHGRVAALPNVKAYLEGSLRLQKVNNNNLG